VSSTLPHLARRHPHAALKPAVKTAWSSGQHRTGGKRAAPGACGDLHDMHLEEGNYFYFLKKLHGMNLGGLHNYSIIIL
jgi:hypothetical protein